MIVMPLKVPNYLDFSTNVICGDDPGYCSQPCINETGFSRKAALRETLFRFNLK